jgi:cysteinyl-tRNA synthetase
MAVENPNLIPTFSGVTWLTPKTDWESTSKFNKEDYNRIKNNLEYLQRVCKELDKSFSKTNLGNDITQYTARFKASDFNNFEQALEKVNVYSIKIGSTQTFLSNNPFIDYNELNRIESACAELYELLCNQYTGRRTLPAMLGVSLTDNFFNL